MIKTSLIVRDLQSTPAASPIVRSGTEQVLHQPCCLAPWMNLFENYQPLQTSFGFSGNSAEAPWFSQLSSGYYCAACPAPSFHFYRLIYLVLNVILISSL